MISSIAVGWRWLRRKVNRTHWAARLLGISPPRDETDQPGLLLIQIDGLSRKQMERALEAGNLPYLSRLIRRGHFSLETFYSGVPSTTPAVQGEIFYGVRAAVPAFQFLHRTSGTVMRMFEPDAAEMIEHELAARAKPLLEGGRSYSNIFRAGAERSRYCSSDLAPDELLRHLHPLKSLVLLLAYAPRFLRILALGAVETALAVSDAVKGVLFKRQELVLELGFIPARVVVCSLVRELVRFRVLLDLERGVQVVHANFLGYDEQSHRRGPQSSFAHWTLKGIDRAIRDIHRAAGRSDYRDYEVIVYSDHGQEESEPYAKRQGRELDEALAEVFARGPLAGRELWMRRMPELGNQLERLRLFFGLKPERASVCGAPDPATQIIVTAMGPLGHLYLPELPDEAAMEAYARDLVATGGVPLVLRRDAGNRVRAYNRRGNWRLPEDRAEVLGTDHPFLEEVATDLVDLCARPDSGDFVISGWDPAGKPQSFPVENGAHGGPGAEETRGFLLVPDRIRRWHLAHLAKTRTRVRGEELRKTALHFLGRDGTREERVPEHAARDAGMSVRVVTYNIHSCRGMDGKVRPERIARVLNSFDPDVVAVQEVDCHRPRSGGHDQAQLIADHLRMTHVFHAMFEEEKERYGIAVFSRHPFELLKAGYLTGPGKGLMRESRGAIWLKLGIEGRPPFHFVNTHFGLGREERHRQTDELLGREWLGGIPDDEPVILCGDFNSRPGSKVYQRLRQHFHDAQLGLEGHRPRATFTSVRPVLRLDHIFTSRHFAVKEIERPDSITAVIASDHLPLCAELALELEIPPA